MRYYESNKYPYLCKFFDSQLDLANAGCVSQSHLSNCLSGKATFTPQQTRAICNEILVNGSIKGDLNDKDKELLLDARNYGRFDEVFKK